MGWCQTFQKIKRAWLVRILILILLGSHPTWGLTPQNPLDPLAEVGLSLLGPQAGVQLSHPDPQAGVLALKTALLLILDISILQAVHESPTEATSILTPWSYIFLTMLLKQSIQSSVCFRNVRSFIGPS